MRIAVLVPEDSANVVYRALMPLQELRRRGHTVATVDISTPDLIPPPHAFAGYDAVYIWRAWFIPLRQLAKALRGLGVAVMWDNDDNISAIPRELPDYRYFGGMAGQRIWAEMVAMMRLCDLVTTPSDVLAERYRRTGHTNVRVIENFVPHARRHPGRALPRRNVVVGWTAAGEHMTDLRKLGLADVFTRLIEYRPNVEVATVGIDAEIRRTRYRRSEWVPLHQLHDHIATFDVGIAPLADTAFNQARSNIKLKEYAANGVPWLASPVGAYRELGEDEGGRLVDADGWFSAITWLVDDVEARRELGERAFAWATEETIAANAELWEEAIESAVERAAVRTG